MTSEANAAAASRLLVICLSTNRAVHLFTGDNSASADANKDDVEKEEEGGDEELAEDQDEAGLGNKNVVVAC